MGCNWLDWIRSCRCLGCSWCCCCSKSSRHNHNYTNSYNYSHSNRITTDSNWSKCSCNKSSPNDSNSDGRCPSPRYRDSSNSLARLVGRCCSLSSYSYCCRKLNSTGNRSYIESNYYYSNSSYDYSNSNHDYSYSNYDYSNSNHDCSNSNHDYSYSNHDYSYSNYDYSYSSSSRLSTTNRCDRSLQPYSECSLNSNRLHLFESISNWFCAAICKSDALFYSIIKFTNIINGSYRLTNVDES